MELKEVLFSPTAHVKFSADEVMLLMEWSKAHPENMCRDASRAWGFLNGIAHSGPDYRYVLTPNQLDTLVKICEIGAERGVLISLELQKVIDKMSSDKPNVRVQVAMGCPHCGSTRTIVEPEDQLFESREGCLNCNRWFNEPKLKNR